MLDAAFRQIAGAVSAAVGGPYAAAKLLYPGTPIFDEGGSIIAPGSAEEVDCRVQVDAATEAMRADADFLEKDVMILLISDRAPSTTPDIRVLAGPFAGTVYSLRSAKRDSLAFAWECRGREVAGAA